MASITVILDKSKTLKLIYQKIVTAIKYTLAIKAYSDSTEAIGVAVTIDGISGATPYSGSLDAKTYTVTVPDQINDAAGNTYNYTGAQEA